MISLKFQVHANEFKFHFFFEKGDVKYVLLPYILHGNCTIPIGFNLCPLNDVSFVDVGFKAVLILKE